MKRCTHCQQDKLCRQCGRYLPLSEFPQRRTARGRLYRSSPCRACTNMGIWICRNRKRAQRNAESRRYYQEHRAEILAQKHAAYQADPERKQRYEKRRRMRKALARTAQALSSGQE